MYSNIADLTLLELPPTLENILIKKLDLPHKCKSEYGWKKASYVNCPLSLSYTEVPDVDEKAEYMNATSTSVNLKRK